MERKAHEKALETARALEKAGKVEPALRAYRELGAVDEVGRLLAAARRYREAGEALLESLRVQPAQVGQLEPLLKKRALMAAIWLSKAGELATAVELFIALGERARAVEALERAGDPVSAAKVKAGEGLATAPVSLVSAPKLATSGASASLGQAQKLEAAGRLEEALGLYVQLRRYGEAARLSHKLGRLADAAQLYSDAGMAYDAALCHEELGDAAKCLDSLVRVPRDDSRYRTAAAHAVRIATELGELTFQLEHFLAAFVASGPQEDAELPTFYELAKLYLQRDFVDNAKEALQKISARAPGYRDVRERLQQLAAQTRATPMMAAQVLEDAGRGSRPSLDNLPPLPGLGMPQRPASPSRASTTDELSGTQQINATIVRTAPGLFVAGATIAGRYRLEEQIGQGGMAQVFRAKDLELDELVALKVFLQTQTGEELVARFKQELKLSRQLQHPNVLRLYDIGLHEGHRYLSMELLVGETLKQRMRRALEFGEAIGYLVQACQGLQAAHDAGVVHRDVKPDNFFVTREGVLKVMDFGIAKQFDAPGVTVAGSIAGTPQYMSPEQIGDFSAVTFATDLYALGICAYEIFTGQLPFTHAELVPLLMKHVNEAPPLPRSKNPSLPEELDRAILKLLSKDPRQRFSSCRELAEELLRIRQRVAGEA